MGENGGHDRREDESELHDLSLNATLEVLAHHHRREILRTLVDAPRHVAVVDELVSRLSNRETKRTGERPGRDQIVMELHHIHLPKLTEVGLVEYDARSQELRYQRHERLEGLLEYLESEVPE